MRRLFRSFERQRVAYLLISGQASILYGAATFSEDVDLWILPTAANVRRFLQALAACRASVYKLTPPLESSFLRRGHGFHFLIPARPQPIYLDVMGRPPRVRGFAEGLRRSRVMDTPWGRLPVVSIPDLVELKKTRRFPDYEVISNLAAVRLAGEASPSRSLLRWAAQNSFRPEDRQGFLRRLGRPATLAECRAAVAREVAALQAKDSAYWRRRIAELRRLHRAGKLLPEGQPVSALLR